MKSKITLVFVSALFMITAFNACSQKKEKKTEKIFYYAKDYSISFNVKAKDEISDSLIVAYLDSSSYRFTVIPSAKRKKYFEIKIDSVANYDAAWMQGFHLSKIFKFKDFRILKNDREVKDKYRNFYFVGDYLGRAALYEFDFFTLKTNLVWSRWGKPILNLFRQKETGNIYFTVAQKLSRSGGFPSIRRAQLFFFDAEKLTVKRIAYYGNGMQLKAGWISPNLFNARFLSLDSLTNVDVIKRVYDYDAEGNSLDTLTERIDLMSVSFTEKKPELKFESTEKKIMINFREKEDTVVTSVVDFGKGIKTDVFKFFGKVASTQWSDNGNYFLTSAIDTAKAFADSLKKREVDLFVVNLRNHKLLKRISGDIDEYMLQGDILIYDQWIEGVKAVSFYDLMKNEKIVTLRFEGGCGINSILNLNNL